MPDHVEKLEQLLGVLFRCHCQEIIHSFCSLLFSFNYFCDLSSIGDDVMLDEEIDRGCQMDKSMCANDRVCLKSGIPARRGYRPCRYQAPP
jgi:hypothetical protein